MESESKFKEWLQKAVDKLNEQSWFQEGKGKWDELDPQSKTYLKFAGVGLSVLFVLGLLINAVWSVHSLKSELLEKRALLTLVQSATDELRHLRETIPSAASSSGTETSGWNAYFETTAGSAGVEKSSLSIQGEKTGSSTEQSKEQLFELGLKHVNLKQIVRYAFMLESGQRPVKLRNLTIDTKGDHSGYLDASLAVSAFTLVTPK
ncbi:MAG: hypothetical protein HYX41_03165 [Bdellovibrio sp.]|nr:hypothetical protein [Bdellovibrio sp.]